MLTTCDIIPRIVRTLPHLFFTPDLAMNNFDYGLDNTLVDISPDYPTKDSEVIVYFSSSLNLLPVSHCTDSHSMSFLEVVNDTKSKVSSSL